MKNLKLCGFIENPILFWGVEVHKKPIYRGKLPRRVGGGGGWTVSRLRGGTWQKRGGLIPQCTLWVKFKRCRPWQEWCAIAHTCPHTPIKYLNGAKQNCNLEALSLLFITNPTFLGNIPIPDLARYDFEQCLSSNCLCCWAYW